MMEKNRKGIHHFQNEQGAILIMGLLCIVLVGILGATAYLTTSNELLISNNYRLARQAFYDADAGVNYAIACIEEGLAHNTLTLGSPSVTVSFAAPSGFSFDTVTTLTRIPQTGAYRFRVTGHAGSAINTIEAVIDQDPALAFGVFGNGDVDMKSRSNVFSYHSAEVDPAIDPSWRPNDSTGEADVGSNTNVTVYNGTHLDGDVGLGNDGSGTEATYTESGLPNIEGKVRDVPRIDPDPLGAGAGDLAADFMTYRVVNNNALGATPAIRDNTISLENGETMTLTAGNYYVSSLTLDNGATLNIDTSEGEVNIYVTGKVEAKNRSHLNLSDGIRPTDFTILSNSSQDIILSHDGVFKGAVYAPYAGISIKNGTDVYGQAWGRTIDIKNAGDFYYDTALKDKWPVDTVSIVSWQDVP